MKITLPIKTVPESNRREHWAQKHRRTSAQRMIAYNILRAEINAAKVKCSEITLTRIAPRELDDDNLATSFKAVRDGVADWLCGKYKKGNDRIPGLQWKYSQRRGTPKHYAVEVEIIS